MRIAFGIVSLFPGGGLQRDCLEIAKLVRSRGHDVTIYAERVSGDVQTDGIPVVTLANDSKTNHGRQYDFAIDFQREANAQCDLTVGFNKLLGLDVLYCADASMYDRLRKQPYLNLLPRYRTFANMEKDCFSPDLKTKTILLSQNQLLEYWRAWRTEPQRMYLLPPTLSAARRKPEYPHRRHAAEHARLVRPRRPDLDLDDGRRAAQHQGHRPRRPRARGISRTRSF